MKIKKANFETFDYVTSNPPFSLSNWSTGFNPGDDHYGRFLGYGIPPDKNGDYAFLLHIIKSLKSTGKGAIILPHGVLFRGGAEAEIRKNILEKCLIKGIIGLPPNLFYGTGIPACIIVIDKENASQQLSLPLSKRGIFIIDAGKGFMKDGNKNRLREQDIHKIVDVFNNQKEVPKFSRFISLKEISDPKNDFNLNIPRYIDSQEEEDIQDVEAHLVGDIPNADIDALQEYWDVYPSLKNDLFGKSKRKNYSQPKVDKEHVKQAIFNHPEFTGFIKEMDKLFNNWKKRNTESLKGLKKGFKPKQTIHVIAEDILKTYSGKALIDKYDVYQHLMNYWHDVMQDDSYLITVDGWKAEPYRILIENKQGKKVDKGWTCDLVPPSLIIDRYFYTEKKAIEKMEADKEMLSGQITELEEEHSGEEGFFADYDKVNKVTVQKRLKEIQNDKSFREEIKVLQQYLTLSEEQSVLGNKLKTASEELDKKTFLRYKTLTENEIRDLVVDNKWMTAIEQSLKTEMDSISQRLTQRLKDLVERYESPLPLLNREVETLEKKVNEHLEKMGFVWN